MKRDGGFVSRETIDSADNFNHSQFGGKNNGTITIIRCDA